MNTIKLWVENKGWENFNYEPLEDLKEEFSERNISIGYEASIGDRASIGYETSIGDRASIGYNLKPIIIQFIGSKHRVTYWQQNRIDIGCNSYSIEFWLENYESIGQEQLYTKEQIEEYGNYIKFIHSIHK